MDGICVGQQAVYQPQMKNKISERILLQNSSCDRAKEEKKKIETKTLNMLFSAQKKKGFYNNFYYNYKHPELPLKFL